MAAAAPAGEEFEVEKILDHKFENNSCDLWYFVKWLGYEEEEENTWEKETSCESADERVLDYWCLLPQLEDTHDAEEKAKRHKQLVSLRSHLEHIHGRDKCLEKYATYRLTDEQMRAGNTISLKQRNLNILKEINQDAALTPEVPGEKGESSYLVLRRIQCEGDCRCEQEQTSKQKSRCECQVRYHQPDIARYNTDTNCLILDADNHAHAIVECSPNCDCKGQCAQSVLSRLQYKRQLPLDLFHTKSKGWAVRALKPIKKGQFISIYGGQVVDRVEYRARFKDYKAARSTSQCLLLCALRPSQAQADFAIDANHQANVARFFNHSCAPNMLRVPVFTGTTSSVCPVMAFFARQDLDAGEELTWDYGSYEHPDLWPVKDREYMMEMNEKLGMSRVPCECEAGEDICKETLCWGWPQ